jgi:hypothetical protein
MPQRFPGGMTPIAPRMTPGHAPSANIEPIRRMSPVRATMGDIDWNAIFTGISSDIKSIFGQAQPYYNRATGTYTYPPNYNPITGQYTPTPYGTSSFTDILIYGAIGFAVYRLLIK